MPKFQSMPYVVEAVRAKEYGIMELQDGPTVVHAGDWLVTKEDGTQLIMSNGVFRHTFTPVNEEAEKAMIEPLEPGKGHSTYKF